MNVYPLRFQPILKPKIWGGRRLQALGKTLPEIQPIGESWEIADLEDDASVVANGTAKGKNLHELVSEWKEDLLGNANLFEQRFPLLIKFLDANDTLSVQVHPDDAMAKRLGGRVRVKNEAWYVIDTTEDGFIYRGVKPGVTAESLKQAIQNQTVESLMQRIPVRKGHCYYLPSGTLHALGAGVLVAEVQTPSDTTYRVYDFGRIEKETGKPRQLHVDQAMQCINLGETPTEHERKQHVVSVLTTVTSLVKCDSFNIERVRMAEGVKQAVTTGEMIIWIILEGQGQITCRGFDEPFKFDTGDTVLLPAAIKDTVVTIDKPSMWLEVTLPIRVPIPGDVGHDVGRTTPVSERYLSISPPDATNS